MSKTIQDGAWTFTATLRRATRERVEIDVVADLPGMDQMWSYMLDGRRLRLISVSEPDSTEIENKRPALRKALAPMARVAREKAAE